MVALRKRDDGMNINTWMGVGRLTKKPSFALSRRGGYECRMRLGINDRVRDDTLYITAVLFGKQVEAYRDYLKKGRMVGISGKIANYHDEVVVLVDDITVNNAEELCNV